MVVWHFFVYLRFAWHPRPTEWIGRLPKAHRLAGSPNGRKNETKWAHYRHPRRTSGGTGTNKFTSRHRMCALAFVAFPTSSTKVYSCRDTNGTTRDGKEDSHSSTRTYCSRLSTSAATTTASLGPSNHLIFLIHPPTCFCGHLAVR